MRWAATVGRKGGEGRVIDVAMRGRVSGIMS